MIAFRDNTDVAEWYYADVQEAVNSHICELVVDEDGTVYEIWLELLPVRDWAALEKTWADTNS